MVQHIRFKAKIISIILCVVIFFIISCAKRVEKKISFAVGGAPNEVEYWETLINKFEKTSGIKVDLLRQPTDTDQRRQGLVIPLKAKQSNPDLFLMDVAWIGQFAASDWLEPLEEYLEEKDVDIEVFFKNILDLADRYNGGLIALPVYVDGGLLYYRKDLLQRYGIPNPPETWNQLVEYSEKIQKEMRKDNPNFYGFVWQGAQYEGLICNFLEFAGSNNGGIILRDGKIILNTSENIQAAQFMYDLIHKFKISPPNTFTEMKEEEVRIYFQQGNALFERNWPYAWALHQSEGSKIKDKIGVAPLPHFEKGKSVSTLGGWHIGISRFSDAKKEAFQFIEFVTSYEMQKQLALKLGWNPGHKGLYEDKEVLNNLSHFAILGRILENTLPRPNIPYYTQISEVMQQNINGLLSGGQEAETALKKAELEIQNIVERYEER